MDPPKATLELALVEAEVPGTKQDPPTPRKRTFPPETRPSSLFLWGGGGVSWSAPVQPRLFRYRIELVENRSRDSFDRSQMRWRIVRRTHSRSSRYSFQIETVPECMDSDPPPSLTGVTGGCALVCQQLLRTRSRPISHFRDNVSIRSSDPSRDSFHTVSNPSN